MQNIDGSYKSIRGLIVMQKINSQINTQKYQ